MCHHYENKPAYECHMFPLTVNKASYWLVVDTPGCHWPVCVRVRAVVWAWLGLPGPASVGGIS